MDVDLRLDATDVVEGRPFTDPGHNAADLAAIRTMAAALRRALAPSPDLPASPRPLVLALPGPEGRQHRAIVSADAALRRPVDLAFVGFFAQRRPGLDYTVLTATDDELILELPAHPGILSYSSLELPDGNWANLILVDPPEAAEHWRTSAKHAYATRELAPRFYAVIRLHAGVLPGGLLSGHEPVLVRTRYYDFQGAAAWRAERALRPG